MPDALAQALRGLLPGNIAVAAADPREGGELWPGEVLPGAVPARLAEFAAGRSTIRRAMAALGLEPAAIPIGPDRAPVWPAGVTGSVTHTAEACLAAVGRSADFAALGIDMEPEAAVARDLWPEICTAAERAALSRLPETDQRWHATLIFCAKEAAYKAQYMLSRRLIGFEALTVEVTRASFTATFTAEAPPFAKGARLAGRWGRSGGQVLTAVTIPA